MEDGLYVHEDKLEDPAEVDKLARFVRASMKGWKWAEENPDTAAMIVLENDATGAQTAEASEADDGRDRQADGGLKR